MRIQENSDEVPAGSLPRSLDVILRHETVENARAGDKVVLTGQLMVMDPNPCLLSPPSRLHVLPPIQGTHVLVRGEFTEKIHWF